jgi:predicted CXXCH cytochrome family protein
VNAAVYAAAGLVFLLLGPALAAQKDLSAPASGDARRVLSGRGNVAEKAAVATDNHAKCGKCHSACEDGRSHEGLLPLGAQGDAGLPLSAEGRTTCITCHDSRRHDAQGASAGHLRISNLRRELCLACHRQATETAPRVEIVSPLEGAVVREERLALIGRAFLLSGSDLTVRLNGSEFHLQAKEGEFSTWLRLQDGTNRIEVAQQGRILWNGEVFHGESALGGYERTSSGHRTGNRAQCLECHLKRGALRSGATGAAPALCYECHDRIGEKRYVHGPLGVGDCLACHDPHGGYGTAHLRKEQALLCGNCHAGRGNTSTMACNAAGRGCVECHDPHQSDARYLLKGPQYTMRVAYPEIR